MFDEEEAAIKCGHWTHICVGKETLTDRLRHLMVRLAWVLGLDT